MKVYKFGHDDVLHMPIKRFWFYNKAAERLQASDDMRMLHLLAGVTSQEGMTKLQESLSEEIGEIYVYQPVAQTLHVSDPTAPDPALDRNGLEALRASILRHGR